MERFDWLMVAIGLGLIAVAITVGIYVPIDTHAGFVTRLFATLGMIIGAMIIMIFALRL